MEDSRKAESAPTMTSLFGSDSEEEDDQQDLDHVPDTEPHNESKDSDNDDVEFQDDGITGIAAPRSRPRSKPQPNPTLRFSSHEDYDDPINSAHDHKDEDLLDHTIEALPPRQIILSEAPALSSGESDVLSSYASASKGDYSFHLVQLPKLVTINTQEYDSASFDAKGESDEFQRQSHSMIRWRHIQNYDDEMEQTRESNANIIQWSDGTWGLAVGDEVFELDEFPFSSSDAKASAESKDFLYLSSKAEVNQFDESKDGGELSDENMIDSAITTILQCIVPLKSKLIPRPASVRSAAHKSFMLAEKSRNMKRANIGEYVPVKDPELEKAERIRNNQDLSKQKKRSSLGEGRSSYGGNTGGRRSFSRSQEVDDGLYDSVNIKDLKRKSHDMDLDEDYGDDDDEEEEDEWSKRKKTLFMNAREGGPKPNRPSALSSDSEDEKNYNDTHASEDAEEKIIARRRKVTKSSLFDEDDEDD